MSSRQASLPPTAATVATSRVSCSEYSFAAVRGQHERIGIVKLLGFELVNVALFLDDAKVLVNATESIAATLGSSLREHRLGCGDLFFTVGASVEEIAPNQRKRGRRLQSRREFTAAAHVAAEVGIRGLTILPGVSWADDPAGSWASCVEELSWRADEAERIGVELRIEPHVGSIVPIPELVTKMCTEVPRLALTLDVSHFDVQAVTLDRTLTLVPLARHVHVRAAKPGAVQVRWRDNETDFRSIAEALDQVRYDGVVCVEYVPMEKWRCNEMDVITETLATRSALSELGLQ